MPDPREPLEPSRSEQDWADAIPDPENDEDPGDAWEKTWPDGSVRHECSPDDL